MPRALTLIELLKGIAIMGTLAAPRLPAIDSPFPVPIALTDRHHYSGSASAQTILCLQTIGGE